MLPYALSIFTGAFLLFQVQPLIGKYILPWFGGGPGVWTTCLLFFQAMLLGGYAYAHFLSTRLRPKRQAVVHLSLLVISLVLLPITPSEHWKEASVSGDPTLQILLLLTATIGLPYFVLSSTGPLMQQWFSETNPGVSPYRLYALSNVGSLLALLSYPVFFEVQFPRHTQATMWSLGLVLFVIFCGYCAYRVWRYSQMPAPPVPVNVVAAPGPIEVLADPMVAAAVTADPAAPAADAPLATAATPTAPASTAGDAAPTGVDKLLWLALPMIASVLLLATTNKLCQEVAVIPFLWVLPLSLYLLSFIISFDHARWYHRGIFTALLVVAMVTVFQLLPAGNDAPMTYQIVGYTVALFVACMVCHGELYQLKPPPRYLTAYFLFISAGGALGGFLVAIVAPAVFDDYRELQIGMWLLSYAVGVLCLRQQTRTLALGVGIGALLSIAFLPWLRSKLDDSEGLSGEYVELFRTRWPWLVAGLALWLWAIIDFRGRRLAREFRPPMAAFLMLMCVALGVVVVLQWPYAGSTPILTASRNFYGTLKVFDYHPNDEEDNYHLLLHGATTHGLQFTKPEKSVMATSYYGENSGIGLALDHMKSPRRIGLVGLGTGSLAVYAKKGDTLRIYEINPDVEKLARAQFTYLENCPAQVEVAMGDARLVMEQELAKGQPGRYDLLALDAFSSDAIPVHLLTKEAFDMYLKHINDDGVIAVHVSNRYLNLRPVVEKLAEQFGMGVAVIYDDDNPDWWIYATTWILVSKNKEFLAQSAIADVAQPAEKTKRPAPLWTDDYASLYSIMKD